MLVPILKPIWIRCQCEDQNNISAVILTNTRRTMAAKVKRRPGIAAPAAMMSSSVSLSEWYRVEEVVVLKRRAIEGGS